MKIILRIPFLSFSNANVEFAKLRKLTWRFYDTIEALPTTKALSITSWVELINKRKFAKIALDGNSMTFVVHVGFPEATTLVRILIHLF